MGTIITLPGSARSKNDLALPVGTPLKLRAKSIRGAFTGWSETTVLDVDPTQASIGAKIGVADDAVGTISDFIHDCMTAGILDYFNIGDYFDFSSLTIGSETITNADLGTHGKLLRYILVGKDEYIGIGGVTAHHLVFHAQNLMKTHVMNASNTNVGGYANPSSGSDFMKTYVEGAVKAAFLNAGLKHLLNVTRKLGTGNATSTAAAYTADVFIPTLGEMGLADYSARPSGENDGVVFDYYNTDAKRIKYLANGSAQHYWTVSPRSSDSVSFCVVALSGVTSVYNAFIDWGCAPAFCVA
jgi:hypothetical protein